MVWPNRGAAGMITGHGLNVLKLLQDRHTRGGRVRPAQAALPLESAERLPARHPDKLAQSGRIWGRSPYGAGPRFPGSARQSRPASTGIAAISGGLWQRLQTAATASVSQLLAGGP